MPLDFSGTASPLTKTGLAQATDHLGIGPAELWTVIAVETSGAGFLPDRRPKILFERHIFSKRTNRKFDSIHPNISNRLPGDYGLTGAHQHDRLNEAIQCDRPTALESASWGLGQVMGFNASAAGYPHAEAMVSDMVETEDAQLMGMIKFIAADRRMHDALRRQNWEAFARQYNGPNFAKNSYDAKLEQHFSRLSREEERPVLNVRAAQLFLTYHGFNPGPVDGVSGKLTRMAIRDFQRRHGLPEEDRINDGLLREMADRLEPRQPNQMAPPEIRPVDLFLLQALLAYLGYKPGPADGVSGPDTQGAISTYQRDRRLQVTGRPDFAVVEDMRTQLPHVFSRVPERDVRMAQTLLRHLGYDPGLVDGKTGPQTEAAVKRFQASHELSATGTIDAASLDRLVARAASR
jgi:peptidoglycan hydrolase-like protein with peptidoglycan-binding domain